MKLIGFAAIILGLLFIISMGGIAGIGIGALLICLGWNLLSSGRRRYIGFDEEVYDSLYEAMLYDDD